jgi:hypothetical protein
MLQANELAYHNQVDHRKADDARSVTANGLGDIEVKTVVAWSDRVSFSIRGRGIEGCRVGDGGP